MGDASLRRGDMVEVRSPAEILATLDQRGQLDGLPFMPEMVQFCGRRFVVDKRADKICDTMLATSRRLPDTVLLEDLRCDGSGHDGCQAECRLFWKEAWLRRVDAGEPAATNSRQDPVGALTELTASNSRRAIASTGGAATEHEYCCQATEHIRASQPLKTWDPRPYIREYTSGNVGFLRFIRVFAYAVSQQLLHKLGLRPAGPVRLTDAPSAVPITEALGLQPGDLVRTKSKPEIGSTLDHRGTHQGIWFDDENVPYCGRTFRVHRRVERYINDLTGRMETPIGCVTLEGSLCTSEHSLGRWFCPRAFYAQWSEGWLERTEVSGSGAQPASVDDRSKASRPQANR